MTVGDVMKLPSMVGAEVIAGHGGLNQPVESVSVLEYGVHSEILDRFYRDGKFVGNEILISSLASIWNDIDAQCENIRKRHTAGTVGLVLYMVGVIVPQIDQKLIDLCDALNFVLICMPKGQITLRYSELIREIMFAVYREQQQEEFFVSTLLERISGLPPQQRNVETLLRMLSEHLRVSIILAEQQRNLYTTASWPQSLNSTLTERFPKWLTELKGKSQLKVPLGDEGGYLQSCPRLLDDSDDLRLFTLRYQEPLSESTLWQASECVRLFLHIWDRNLGKFVISELVRAIINDDSIHKDHLSHLFRVRVQDLNQMWLFFPKSEHPKRDERLLHLCTDYFSVFPPPVLVSYYEETLVVFAHTISGNSVDDLLNSWENINNICHQYEIVCCDCLRSSADARQAYLISTTCWKTARKIYPHAKVLQMPDLIFSKLCQETIENLESLEQYLRLLKILKENNADLIPTVATYLLDTASNIAETAKRLHVHLNTVKYRLRKIQELTGFSPSKMPGAYSLYICAAVARSLEENY